jgi:hypothetical protein
MWGAEGANPARARPDETLRQKDPVPAYSGKSLHRDTDGAILGEIRIAAFAQENLSGLLQRRMMVIHAPFLFAKSIALEKKK